MVRRIIPIIIIVALSAGYAGTSFAQEDERGTAWYLRGSFGAASQDLSDLESALLAEKDELKNLGIDFSTYSNSFGNVWDYRVEVGAIITRGLSLGFLFDYQPRESDLSTGGIAPQDQIRMSENISINYYGFLGSLSYWFPGTHGFFLGATAGYGSGRFKQTITLVDPNNPQFNAESKADYDGGGPVYGFNGGYQFTADNGILFYLQVGFEWRDLGTFTGSTQSTAPQLLPEQSGIYTVGGEEINFDFSGPFVAIGFGFTGPY